MKRKAGKSLEESVVTVMGGTDPEIYPFLPYILQDVWEIGASPEVMVRMAQRHVPKDRVLEVLDLGCGKGAVSVAMARMLPCRCRGIDAVGAFIEEARKKALAFGVADKCAFETGDIRDWVGRHQAGKVLPCSKTPHGEVLHRDVSHREVSQHNVPQSDVSHREVSQRDVSQRDVSGSDVSASPTILRFDVIVLGAIGPVLGNYFYTLTRLVKLLARDGIVLIDDGYIPDDSTFTHPLIQKRGDVIRQVSKAGMRLVDEEIISADDMQSSNEAIHQPLVRRCRELMEKHPEKRSLFEGYIHKQEEEIDILENRIICSTMVLKR